jgi:hypothetical protein
MIKSQGRDQALECVLEAIRLEFPETTHNKEKKSIIAK